MTRATERLLKGRQIVAFKSNPFDDGRGGVAHDPVIVLDNGATLTFVVRETEGCEYGVDVTYTPKLKAKP